ncbi:MAG: hypothetical protein KA149_03905 [Chitinophagales bacterium]|nr:hypothetical protein [Chitinophagales bacterium]
MQHIIKSIILLSGLFQIASCTTEEGLCAPGLEGSDCKTETRARFLGSFTGRQACTTGSDSLTIGISAVTGDFSKVEITGLYIQPGFKITGTTLTDGSIKIAEQPFGTGQIRGLALFEDSKLKITFGITENAGSPADSCTWIQK